MAVFTVDGPVRGGSTDPVGATPKTGIAGSEWQTKAESKWGTTAVWIHGDGQFALLQPCSDQLTVTLCASMVDATRVKKETCCGRCSKSRHVITDLAD
jgi:hypothetical protein